MKKQEPGNASSQESPGFSRGEEVNLVVLAPILLGSTPDLWAAFGVALADAFHALWELWTNGVARVFSLGAFG